MSFLEFDRDYFSKERVAPMTSDQFFYKGDYRDMNTDDDDDDPELEAEPRLTSVGADDSITSSKDTTTDAKRHIFPFFELAGKLRNLIYDYCIADTDLGICNISGVQVIAKNVTKTTSLLISKRFQYELKTRQPRTKTAALRGFPWDMGLDIGNFTIPPSLLLFENIEIY